MRAHLRWPSPWRVIGFIAAAVALFSALTGIILYANAIATHNDPQPTPVGDYVRLFIVDITMWGPAVLLTVWPVSAPVVLAGTATKAGSDSRRAAPGGLGT